MQSKATTVDSYISELPEERKIAIDQLRAIINNHIPDWFEEQMQYGMIWRVVPFSLFPQWYHCDPKQPLPFVALASQKNHIALYHMGVYSFPDILEWFTSQYPNYSTKKLDMGKSCIRRTKESDIPYELIGELLKKISVGQWIEYYQTTLDSRASSWKKS